LKPYEIENALMADGWFMRKASKPADLGQESWPPAPFAPLHYAFVTSPHHTGHAVAVDARGKVYDPYDARRARLDVYPALHSIVGLRR
jgi:hypothetical protein